MAHALSHVNNMDVGFVLHDRGSKLKGSHSQVTGRLHDFGGSVDDFMMGVWFLIGNGIAATQS
jgi:hypothetical protein